MKKLFVLWLILLIVVMGCEKQATSPNKDTTGDLSDSEQMEIVAAEVAAKNGGVVAEVSGLAEIAKGVPGSLAKAASYDTSFTRSWITYSVSLSFFTAQGTEQVFYVPNITDKIVYKSSVTGHYSSTTPKREIELNKQSSFVITGIVSGIITVNGKTNNHSSYKLSGPRAEIAAEVSSELEITNLVIDKNTPGNIPQSGKLECSFHGTYTRTGVVNAKEVEYNFHVVIEFNGGTQVKVTLPSGNKFTLDIVTGDFS
ncbi:MAG: hypothetical protein ONB16_05265 [candidate division KSB1 bacterium]|nr:hypothetical protein [candidate division KSB1 bacterium]MDZ7319218.1 hypothetical protein [candidate division KSB1 bacterium]MDZ7341785.1 hypothetical protein [candidate division KSB1 bacterium]